MYYARGAKIQPTRQTFRPKGFARGVGDLGKGGTQQGWSTAVPFMTAPWAGTTSAPKSKPADDLSEVVVNARRVEEPMPEIVVTGQRIPWYVWAMLGATAVAFITAKGKRS